MIDFPASPTDGQIFSATNGVVYKYSATYTSWLAQNAAPALGGTGQVTVSLASWSIPSAGVDLVVPFATVQNGNAGLWYNTTTFRYTPPAGAYFLTFTASMLAPSGGNGTSSVFLRKNGVRVPEGYNAGSGSALFSIPISYGVYVDANGSDYFDWVVNNTSGTGWQNGFFSAFPLTGIQGPTGGAPGPVVGDFFAFTSTAGSSTSAITILFNSIITGNSGGYYNPTTGRFTPPAGRYKLDAHLWGYSNVSNVQMSLIVRKNGVAIVSPSPYNNSAGANYAADVSYDCIVDANGSDWFDVQQQCNVALSVANASFSATPTQGMVGPQGPAGPPGVTPDIPQNSQPSNYTLALSDAGKHIYHPLGAGLTGYTIPPNSSVAFNIGTAITFVNDDTNAVAIFCASDSMVISPGGTGGTRSLAQFGMATALKVATTRWLISGTGLT